MAHPVATTHRTGLLSGALARSPVRQAFELLHIGFVAAPVIAGADKFLHLLTDWDKYLSPALARLSPVGGHGLMLVVGAVEIVAGLVVALKPRIGAYVVAAWLAAIILNLVALGGYLDVALRDLGLMLGALALGRLAEAHARGLDETPASVLGRQARAKSAMAAKVIPIERGKAAEDKLTDEDVIERVRGGEVALFELLMRRHNRRLFRVAWAVVKNDAEAEDVLQQAYLSAFVHLSQFEGRARVSTWLTSIVLNEARGRARRRSEDRMSEEQADPIDHATPEAAAARREAGRMLERALARLPTMYAEVFVLREMEELSTAEAAEALGVSEDVVKVRLFRAKALLREEIWQSAGSATREALGFDGARCDRIVAAVLGSIGARPR